MITILGGNDFRLIVQAKESTGSFVSDMDLSDVDDLRIYLFKPGRSKVLMSYSLDEYGRAVVPVSADEVSSGAYNIEVVGMLRGSNVRATKASAFIIRFGGSSGVLTDYEIDVILATNTPVSSIDVDNKIRLHNEDTDAHPSLIAALGEKIDDVQVDGESVIETVDMEGETKRVAKISFDGMREITDGLQDQIDSIIAGKAQVSLAASPSLVYLGQQSTIQLTASSDTAASEITISGGNLQNPITGSGKSLSANDVITPSGNTSYTATFVIAGTTKTASRTVAAVRPVYYGAGASAEAASNVASIRTSPAGTYNVTVATDGSYIYWVVPNTMSISGATMNGFDFPLDAPESIVKDGVAYKAYRSSNTIDAGTHTIIIR